MHLGRLMDSSAENMTEDYANTDTFEPMRTCPIPQNVLAGNTVSVV